MIDQRKEYGGYSIFSESELLAYDAFDFSNNGTHLLSLGRHCLRAACDNLRPIRVILPHYTCQSIKHEAMGLGLDILYYNIDENFIPSGIIPQSGDLFVINNYYGLASNNRHWMNFLQSLDPKDCLLDNTQSLFAGNQFKRFPNFISPRKFLPVTDGGILDVSWDRIQWLFRAIDEGGKMGSYSLYSKYRSSAIQNIAYSRMSKVTQYLLQRFDVVSIINQRNTRFALMQSTLPLHHRFHSLSLGDDACPIGYPVSVINAEITQSTLAAHNIYSIRFWPELEDSVYLNSFEQSLVKNTLFLPYHSYHEKDELSLISDILSISRK